MANNQQVKDSTPTPPRQGPVFQSYLDFIHTMSLPGILEEPDPNYQQVNTDQQEDSFVLTPSGIRSQKEPVVNPKENYFPGYNLASYNTADPHYFSSLYQIYNSIPEFSDTKAVDNWIATHHPNSPLKANMFVKASAAGQTDPRILMAIAQKESQMGTAPRAVKYNNATGYGAYDDGTTFGYKGFQDNLDATAKNLAKRKLNSTPTQPSPTTTEPPLLVENQ